MADEKTTEKDPKARELVKTLLERGDEVDTVHEHLKTLCPKMGEEEVKKLVAEENAKVADAKRVKDAGKEDIKEEDMKHARAMIERMRKEGRTEEDIKSCLKMCNWEKAAENLKDSKDADPKDKPPEEKPAEKKETKNEDVAKCVKDALEKEREEERKKTEEAAKARDEVEAKTGKLRTLKTGDSAEDWYRAGLKHFGMARIADSAGMGLDALKAAFEDAAAHSESLSLTAAYPKIGDTGETDKYSAIRAGLGLPAFNEGI